MRRTVLSGPATTREACGRTAASYRRVWPRGAASSPPPRPPWSTCRRWPGSASAWTGLLTSSLSPGKVGQSSSAASAQGPHHFEIRGAGQTGPQDHTGPFFSVGVTLRACSTSSGLGRVRIVHSAPLLTAFSRAPQTWPRTSGSSCVRWRDSAPRSRTTGTGCTWCGSSRAGTGWSSCRVSPGPATRPSGCSPRKSLPSR